MHYYKRNLGDYAKKAGRLSMLQHGSYTLLIDACYDRERFPTLDEAIEWTWASTAEEIEAVSFVLRKFFTLSDGVYTQSRIQEEIDVYHSKSEINTRIAIERETKRKEKRTNRARVVNEPPPNHKPLTINQDKNKTFAQTSFSLFWKAYPKKKSKGDAEKAWNKIKPNEPLVATIVAKIEQAKTSDDWRKQKGQFIPYPATWLNARCWEDENDESDFPNGFEGAI